MFRAGEEQTQDLKGLVIRVVAMGYCLREAAKFSFMLRFPGVHIFWS